MNTGDIRIDDCPPAGDLAFVEAQINAFNIERIAADDFRALAGFVRDRGTIVAGISGYTWAGMCEIRFLWVHEQLRGRGYGSQLLAAAEGEALARGCSIVVLNSYSFQAPLFYQRLGYQVGGSIRDSPPGHTHVFLYKRLAPSHGDSRNG